MPKHVIVTTCGTSLVTNQLLDEPDALLRRLIQHHSSHAETDIPADERTQLSRHIGRRRLQLTDATVDQTCRMSAELNGILNFHDRQTPFPAQDVHILIHTDTWLGEQVAVVLAEKLRQLGATPHSHRAESLSTADLASFQHGLGNLVEWASQTLPGYRHSQYRVVFNLVGGFKSVQGFMQTLGMFYADEILYIFESGSQLLRIPRLPVDLDSAAKKVIAERLSFFRRLDSEKTVSSDNPDLTEIPESFLYRLGDETELGPWGRIIWKQARRSLYREKLQESPTDRIAYADRFRSDASALPSDRLEILNTRIDDLTRYLLEPDRPNPKRLDLKRLRGNPMPPSNYECDAWADADCRRIFLTLDGDRATLNRVTSALH